MIVLMMFLILLALICLNVPIAVGLAVAAIFGVGVSEGLDSIVTLALDMYDGSTKFSLIAIPMFVLAGAIMNAGGITDRLINFVNAIIGFVRGGLAMVNIGVSLFFAEISGSIIFYFKDLSLALGQTNRIPLILSVWAPVIALTLFTSIGVIQINEK